MQNCIAVGSLGSEEALIKKIKKTTVIKKKEILNKFNKKNEELSQDSYKKQIDILEKLTLYGHHIEDYKMLPKDSRYKSIFIKSAAGVDDGESFIRYYDGISVQEIQGFTRGLNLVGFSNDKSPKIIHKLDTCGFYKELESENNITEILNKSDYSFYLLVSHDSTVCESSELLNKFMSGSNLKLWSDLAWRQAYISVIKKDGEPLELLGEKRQSIKVGLK
jgi:hypothetical protein